MSGIYKVTMGHWDANGEAVEDDYTEDYQVGASTMDEDQVPPPGTMAYLLGIPGMPDGIYTVGDPYISTNDDDNSSGGVTDNAV